MLGLGDGEVALLVATSFAIFASVVMALATTLAHVLFVLGHAHAAGDALLGFQFRHKIGLGLLDRNQG